MNILGQLAPPHRAHSRALAVSPSWPGYGASSLRFPLTVSFFWLQVSIFSLLGSNFELCSIFQCVFHGNSFNCLRFAIPPTQFWTPERLLFVTGYLLCVVCYSFFFLSLFIFFVIFDLSFAICYLLSSICYLKVLKFRKC